MKPNRAPVRQSAVPTLSGPPEPSSHAAGHLPASGEEAFAPYFRNGDPLCKRFLALGADAASFELVKLVFPLVREASVLQLPRNAQSLASWLTTAAVAGHRLGKSHPDLADRVLPEAETAAALDRLRLIRSQTRRRAPTPGVLTLAFRDVQQRQWADATSEEAIVNVLLNNLLDAFRAGFAAATVALDEPDLLLFAESFAVLPDDYGDLYVLRLFDVVRQSVGVSPAVQMRHPLLKLADQHSSTRPVERAAQRPFFECRIRNNGRPFPEDQCPVDDVDMLQWVRRARAYARTFRRKDPGALQAVLRESAAHLDEVRRLIAQAKEDAGGPGLVPLTRAILKWHRDVYGWAALPFYAQQLSRVVHCVDFAMWMVWLDPVPARGG